MPKEKRKYKQVRFDLYPEDEADARLLKALQEKAVRGKMRQWIVDNLLIAIEVDKNREQSKRSLS